MDADGITDEMAGLEEQLHLMSAGQLPGRADFRAASLFRLTDLALVRTLGIAKVLSGLTASHRRRTCRN